MQPCKQMPTLAVRSAERPEPISFCLEEYAAALRVCLSD